MSDIVELFVTQEEYDALVLNRSIIKQISESGNLDRVPTSTEVLESALLVYNIIQDDSANEEYVNNIKLYLEGSDRVILRAGELHPEYGIGYLRK